MRITVLTTSFPRSINDDAGIFIKKLVEAFSLAEQRGTVIVPLDKDEHDREWLGNFNIIRFRYSFLLRGNLAFGEGIIPKLKRNPLLILQAPLLILCMARTALKEDPKADIIHANWIGAAIAAWLVSALTRKPYVITFRGEDIRLACNKLLYPLMRPVLKSAAAITSVNQNFLDALQTAFKIPLEKLRLLPNGVETAEVDVDELAEFRTKKHFSSKDKYLLSIGTVIPRKRVELLIDLIARPELDRYTLILCGRLDNENYVSTLKLLLEQRQLTHRVRFEGQVSPSEVPYYLASAECFITASNHEGRPNALMEAIVAQRPVFASDISAHREMLGENHPALFRTEDLQLVAQRIAQANYPMVNIFFPTWQQAAEGYLQLFSKIVSAKKISP